MRAPVKVLLGDPDTHLVETLSAVLQDAGFSVLTAYVRISTCQAWPASRSSALSASVALVPR